MTIRKCKIDELGIVMELIKESVQDMQARGLDQWDEIYPNTEVISNDIFEGNLYVYAKEKIAGIIVLNEHQDKEYQEVNWILPNERPMVIHRLCIHPNYQSKGIARAMVSFAEEFAKSQQYLSIRLDTFSENDKACRLYEKLGYKNVGTVTFRKGLFFCFEKILDN